MLPLLGPSRCSHSAQLRVWASLLGPQHPFVYHLFNLGQILALVIAGPIAVILKEVLVERLLVHETVEIWQEVMEARRQL